MIVYNPQHSRGRIRFTLAVQLAHILLGHMNGMPQNRATDMEAAYFAKELLMPIAVLDHVGARSRQSIARFCDVSQMAAGYRARDFERRDRFRNGYGETEYDIRFLVQLLEGTVERASEN